MLNTLIVLWNFRVTYLLAAPIQYSHELQAAGFYTKLAPLSLKVFRQPHGHQASTFTVAS